MTDEEFKEKWPSLSKNQKQFVQAYAVNTTKKAAAEEVGLHHDTVYDWDDIVFDLAEHIVDKRAEGLMSAVEGLSQEAVEVLKRALDPNTEIDRTTQETAEYILNRIEGRPTRKQQVEHSGGIDLSEDDVDDALEQL